MICWSDSFDIVAGDEGVDAVEMAVVPDYIQGVGADGAGGSEQGQAFHFKQLAAAAIITRALDSQICCVWL